MINHTDLKFKDKLLHRDINDIRYIVVHHSEVSSRHTVKDIHRWHLNKGWAGIGYHFFIDKDGVIHSGRPVWAIGAHTFGYNKNSISICMEGNFNKQQAEGKQIESAALLIALLGILYDGAAIVRHSDLTKTKNCPGKNFPFKSLCLMVMKYKYFLNALRCDPDYTASVHMP